MNRPIRRWTADRKLQVLNAIASRQMTRSQAMAAYSITEEELTTWETRSRLFGTVGLKQTKFQELAR